MASSRMLTWQRVEALVDRLARALSDRPGGARFERIVAVARGGLAPAALLAGRLDVACVESVQVRAYEHRQARALPVLEGSVPAPCGRSGDPDRTLIVDELVETGGTLALLQRHLPEAQRAVLVVKGGLCPGSPPTPGRVEVACLAAIGQPGHLWAAEQAPPDAWIVFPWSPEGERDADQRGALL